MIYNSPVPPPERDAYSVPKALAADARKQATHSSAKRVFRCIFFPQKRSASHDPATLPRTKSALQAFSGHISEYRRMLWPSMSVEREKTKEPGAAGTPGPEVGSTNRPAFRV